MRKWEKKQSASVGDVGLEQDSTNMSLVFQGKGHRARATCHGRGMVEQDLQDAAGAHLRVGCKWLRAPGPRPPWLRRLQKNVCASESNFPRVSALVWGSRHYGTWLSSTRPALLVSTFGTIGPARCRRGRYDPRTKFHPKFSRPI